MGLRSTANAETRPAFNRLWQAPIFIMGATALFLLAQTRAHWSHPERWELYRLMRQARECLTLGAAPPGDALALLWRAEPLLAHAPSRGGEFHFLLGWAWQKHAASLVGGTAIEAWRSAREHLETAYRETVSPADTANLVFRLGLALAHTGGPPEQVVQFLSSTIEQTTDDRFDGFACLVKALLAVPKPNLEAALELNEKLLLQPVESERVLAPYRLQRGELLLRMHARESARKSLARIGPDASPEVLFHARRLRATSHQEDEQWPEAAKVWEEAIVDPQTLADGRELARYWLGHCLLRSQQPEPAVRAWQSIASTKSELGRAAALRLGIIYAEGKQYARAIESFEQGLGTVREPGEFASSLIELPSILRDIERACDLARDARQLDQARRLAMIYKRIANAASSNSLLGRVEETWAGWLVDKAKLEQDPIASASLAAEAVEHYLAAAESFRRAAMVTEFPLADKASLLWHAGRSACLGHDYHAAIQAFDSFMQIPVPHDNRGEALYLLGEAHLALGESEKADQAFKACIAQGDSFMFRARFQLARALKDQGKLESAEEVLKQNLSEMGLKKDALAEEQSLYSLAEVLFLREELTQAASRWEQALAKYPTNPEVLRARYLLGRCYRKLADKELQSLGPDQAGGIERARHSRRQFNQWITKADIELEKLVNELEAKRSRQPSKLATDEERLLRQAKFALAACRYERDYEQAIILYEDLADRYPPPDLDGLLALKQLYLIHILLSDRDRTHYVRAGQVLRKCRQYLDLLDPRDFRARPEVDPPEIWQRWLGEMEKQLEQLRITPETVKTKP